MSDQAPPVLRTFRDALRALPQPEKWMVQVEPQDGTLGDGRYVAPPGRDVELEVWLAANGMGEGTYRTELVPMAANPATAKAARNRVRNLGPLADSVTITAAHVAAAAEARESTAKADDERKEARVSRQGNFTGAVRAAVARDPEVQGVTRAAEMARAETDRVLAEIGLAKARRDLAREQDSAPARSERREEAPSWIASLAPILGELAAKMIAGAERREALFASLLEHRSTSAPVPSAAAGGVTLDALTSLIPSVRSLFDLFRELGDGGDGGGGEKSQLGEIAEIVKSLLPAPGSAPTAPAPRRRPQPLNRVDPRAGDPVNLGKVRVVTWLGRVQREASIPSDPIWAAQVLALGDGSPFGSLPVEFQALVLGSSTDAVLAGLGRWMPQAAHASMLKFLAANAPAKQWLVAFIEEIQSGLNADEDDEEQDDDEAEEDPFHAANGTQETRTATERD